MHDTHACVCVWQESQTRRVDAMNSEALTHATGYAVNQTYLQSVVSQSRHVLRSWVGKKDGDIGRNADGSLYLQLFNAVNKAGVQFSRVRLHDPGNLMAKALGNGDWLENLLRVALEQEALAVLFVYDSMRDGMGSEVAPLCLLFLRHCLLLVFSCWRLNFLVCAGAHCGRGVYDFGTEAVAFWGGCGEHGRGGKCSVLLQAR